MVGAINIRIKLYFSTAKNIMPAEDIFDMHNIDNMLTEAARYNRVNYGRPSVTDYRQAECMDDRQTNWLACEQLGPLDSAAMR